MNVLRIVINSIEDAKAGKKIVETATAENTVECKEPVTIAFLEKGMTSGKTSVMITLIAPDGTHYLGQCSGENFEQAYSAFKGAKERFGS